jgi:type II secretory pathway pseudopilin PulG
MRANRNDHTALMTRARADVGETLVEILLTIVVIGVSVTGLLSSLATAGNAGNAQRGGVKADTVLRSYAEATKAAAQKCIAGAPFTVTYVSPPLFPVGTIPAGTVCPGPNTSPDPFLLPLTLTVTGPLSVHDSLDVVVRTP